MHDEGMSNEPLEKTAMDRIILRDLSLRCILGVYEEERRERREILLTVALEGDFRAAARSDDLADAVNYDEIEKQLIALVEASSFCLIESLAGRVADCCLKYPGVRRVTVTLDKPAALRCARSVALEITRSN